MIINPDVLARGRNDSLTQCYKKPIKRDREENKQGECGQFLKSCDMNSSSRVSYGDFSFEFTH